jgi:hypothetical protein
MISMDDSLAWVTRVQVTDSRLSHVGHKRRHYIDHVIYLDPRPFLGGNRKKTHPQDLYGTSVLCINISQILLHYYPLVTVRSCMRPLQCCKKRTNPKHPSKNHSTYLLPTIRPPSTIERANIRRYTSRWPRIAFTATLAPLIDQSRARR